MATSDRIEISRGIQSAVAPAQFLGFSLQTTRCLARVLGAQPGSFVSVEVFDDVGVSGSSGPITAEQDKSALSGNPIADRSPELWKTLGNWIEAASAGTVDPTKTQFELYVSRQLSGEFVQSFSDASTPQAARAAIEKAKTVLWGAAPGHARRLTVSTALAPQLERVFGADEKFVSSVIRNFCLKCGSGSAHDDLAGEPAMALVPAELRSDTLKFGLGLVKEKIDRLIEQKFQAFLSVDEVRKEIMAFVRKHDRRTILTSFALTPSWDAVEGDLSTRTYVRQLELIDSDYDECLRAVNDFLRASTDRAQWSEKGDVQPESFDEFAENLQRTWDNLRRKCALEHNDRPEVERGKLLYQDCAMHQAQLQGMAVPSHFTPGSFHSLSDTEQIGWHPDYKNQLRVTPSKRSKKP